MTTKTKSDFLKLGWYQIAGGGIGALIILYSYFNTGTLSGLNTLVYIFMLLFFFYSIVSGLFCLQLKDTALRFSLINQILQLVGFAFLGFAFSYIAGLYLSVGLDLSRSVEFQFDFGVSKFDFNINRQQERTEININLVAFGLIYWIDKLAKRIKEEKEETQIVTIGQS